jgi:hypothetical protein
MMSAAMMMRLSVVVSARPVSDNHHVSELVDIRVATVLIDENHLLVPMARVTRDVVILAAMTARLCGAAS